MRSRTRCADAPALNLPQPAPKFRSECLAPMSAIRTTRAALPAMLAASRGVIVSICSVNARLPDPAVMDKIVPRV